MSERRASRKGAKAAKVRKSEVGETVNSGQQAAGSLRDGGALPGLPHEKGTFSFSGSSISDQPGGARGPRSETQQSAKGIPLSVSDAGPGPSTPHLVDCVNA